MFITTQHESHLAVPRKFMRIPPFLIYYVSHTVHSVPLKQLDKKLEHVGASQQEEQSKSRDSFFKELLLVIEWLVCHLGFGGGIILEVKKKVNKMYIHDSIWRTGQHKARTGQEYISIQIARTQSVENYPVQLPPKAKLIFNCMAK